MKDLAQYPVSFPYGSILPPYTAAHPHRGNDRAAPNQTPITVSGAQIGLVGMTGLADGFHCHIQEWLKSYDNVRRPLNEFKPGTVIETGFHPEFGNFVSIQNADGWVDTYCHMSRIDVAKGKVIGGNDMVVDDALARRLYSLSTLMAQPGNQPDRQPTLKEIQDAIGRDAIAFCDYLMGTAPWGGNWNKVKHYDEDVKNAAAGTNAKVLEKGTYKVL